MQVQIQSNDFTLDVSGALFWDAEKVLFIADLHLGKIEHFRANGSAIPQEASLKNYSKLDEVIQHYQPSEIVFLGDLFHSIKNKSWIDFESWVKKQQAKITLVVGNHDLIAKSNFEKLGIEVCLEWKRDFIYGTHHPSTSEGLLNLCGHIHPGYFLKGLGKQNLKLSCFYLKEKQFILPAFGGFTGKYMITPEDGERIFVLGENQVFEVPILQ